MTAHNLESAIAHQEDRLAELEHAAEKTRARIDQLRAARRAMQPMEPNAIDVGRSVLSAAGTIHKRELVAALRARIARYAATDARKMHRLAGKYLSAWPFARSVGKGRWAWVPERPVRG